MINLSLFQSCKTMQSWFNIQNSICNYPEFNIHSWWKLSILGVEENFFNLIKSIYLKNNNTKKPTGNITFNGERLHVFRLRSGKEKMSALT